MEMLLTHLAASTPRTRLPAGRSRHIAAGRTRRPRRAQAYPLVAVTEHPFSATERLVIAFQPSPAAVRGAFTCPGWRVGAIHYGQVSADGACALPGKRRRGLHPVTR